MTDEDGKFLVKLVGIVGLLLLSNFLGYYRGVSKYKKIPIIDLQKELIKYKARLGYIIANHLICYDPKMDGTSSFRFTGVLGRGRVDNIVEIFDKVCGNEK